MRRYSKRRSRLELEMEILGMLQYESLSKWKMSTRLGVQWSSLGGYLERVTNLGLVSVAVRPKFGPEVVYTITDTGRKALSYWIELLRLVATVDGEVYEV